MAVLQPPGFIAGTFSLASLRAYSLLGYQQDPGSASVLRPLGGVIPRGGNLDMPVTVAGSTVTVGGGAVVVPGSESGSQFGYLLVNDAAVSFTIPSAPTGQTRRDLIVARVRDTTYSGAFTDGDLVLVQGTAASSGAALPAAPNNALVVAEVSTTGTAAPTATAKLGYTCAPGGIRPARGGTVDDLVPPQYAGQYRDIGGVLQRGDGPGGAWVPVLSTGEWVEATPALKYGAGTAVGLGTGGTAKVRSQVQGKQCRIRYHFTFGSTPVGGSGAIYTEPPAGLVPHPTGIQRVPGVIRVPPNGGYGVTSEWTAFLLFDPATPSVVSIVATAGEAQAYLLQFRAAGGSPAQAVPAIPSGSPIVNGTRLDFGGVLELA